MGGNLVAQEQALWRPITLQSRVSGTGQKATGQESLHVTEDTVTDPSWAKYGVVGDGQEPEGLMTQSLRSGRQTG